MKIFAVSPFCPSSHPVSFDAGRKCCSEYIKNTQCFITNETSETDSDFDMGLLKHEDGPNCCTGEVVPCRGNRKCREISKSYT